MHFHVALVGDPVLHDTYFGLSEATWSNLLELNLFQLISPPWHPTFILYQKYDSVFYNHHFHFLNLDSLPLNYCEAYFFDGWPEDRFVTFFIPIQEDHTLETPTTSVTGSIALIDNAPFRLSPIALAA